MSADRSDGWTATPALLALDWGTSSLRGALLDAHGAVLDERSSADGLLSVPAGAWAARFDTLFGDWMARWPQLVCLMAGMVGSRQGWVEVPYRDCPATLGDLVAGLHWLPGGRLAIVPGLCVDHGGGSGQGLGTSPGAARVPDVMRGEETQVFGALQLLGLRQATLLLPGTHSKWVQVHDGRVLGFRTHMTGECYALLRHQSILAKGLPALVAGAADEAFDAPAFDDGVRQAGQAGGLLHHLFGVRSLGLFDRATPQALASRLSGLLIGEELRAQAIKPGSAVVVIGNPALALRYERALALHGVPVRTLGSQASWQGLVAIQAAWRRSASRDNRPHGP